MTLINTPNSTDSKFRSILKPSKLLWRNNKTNPLIIDDNDKQVTTLVKEEANSQEEENHLKNNKSFLSTPTIGSFHLKIKPSKKFPDAFINEVYELSTVDEEGSYIAPDINTNKHDHDFIGDNDFQFFVPSHDCLTRNSGQHSFFTPSTLIVSV
ncbi:unnamed protein product [Cunninghamella blakesleeana]